MKALTLTQECIAAGNKAGDRSAKRGQRTQWIEADYFAACNAYYTKAKALGSGLPELPHCMGSKLV